MGAEKTTSWSLIWRYEGRIPSKKNSRINLPNGRSIPSRAYREWEEVVRWHFRKKVGEPVEGPLRLEVITTLKNDLDNLLSSVMDAMEGVVYANDRQIQEVRAERVKGKRKVTTMIVSPSSPISGEDGDGIHDAECAKRKGEQDDREDNVHRL